MPGLGLAGQRRPGSGDYSAAERGVVDDAGADATANEGVAGDAGQRLGNATRRTRQGQTATMAAVAAGAVHEATRTRWNAGTDGERRHAETGLATW